MRKLILAVAVAVGSISAPAFAQDRAVVIEQQDADAHPDFEAGFQAGFPTGLSLKAWLDRTSAVAGAVSWLPGNDAWIANVDYLVHTRSMVDSPDIAIPFYVGLGGRFIQFDRNDTAIGPRVPIGVTALMKEVPVSVFAEIAPALEFEQQDDNDTVFTADAAVGARITF